MFCFFVWLALLVIIGSRDFVVKRVLFVFSFLVVLDVKGLVSGLGFC